jgi:hypothetical protein
MSQEVKFKIGPDGYLREAKPPGRPKKIAGAHRVGEGLSANEIARLWKELTLLPEVAVLSSAEQRQLVEELSHGLAYFPLMRPAMDMAVSKKRGNRRKVEIQVLIRDCSRALAMVTGKPAPIWSSPAANSESLAVKVARIALGVARGTRGSFQGDLKRQVELAAKMVVGD